MPKKSEPGLEMVRVRLDSGDEVNLSAIHAAESGVEVLDESAYNADLTLREPTRNGRPPKPHTSVADAAANKKESDR